MNILVVDDNASVLSQLQQTLTANSYNISTAINGLDGYEKAQTVNADLIIVDHLMPLMNGIQLSKNIKQSDHLSDTPIIFMTTQNVQSVKDLVEESLFSEILSKPIDENKLLCAIEQLNQENTLRLSL